MTKSLPSSIPGLGADPEAFREALWERRQVAAARSFKSGHPKAPPVVVLCGGTGTGKSTLFNILSGGNWSLSGVTRPCTRGTVLSAPGPWAEVLARSAFFQQDQVHVHEPDKITEPLAGDQGALHVVQTTDGGPILVDSPDIDSVEAVHERMAARLFYLADLILFCATPEKYADAVGAFWLNKARTCGKSLRLVVNKEAGNSLLQDMAGQFALWGISGLGALYRVPWTPSGDAQEIARAAEPFVQSFSAMIQREGEAVKKQEQKASRRHEENLEKRLSDMLQAETTAWDSLALGLESGLEQARADLSAKLGEKNKTAATARLKIEIQRLYKRYDLLAPVRGFVKGILLSPVKLLGLARGLDAQKQIQGGLPREKLDSAPLVFALSGYQARARSLAGMGPLSKALEKSSPQMPTPEALDLMEKGLVEVDAWLKTRFQEMEKGLPKHKQAGIYGMTMAWGALIVSLEIIIGGGLSLFELALDSVLAPFVTAGTLELFVVSELKETARQLRARYVEVLSGVLEQQHLRYMAVLDQLKPH